MKYLQELEKNWGTKNYTVSKTSTVRGLIIPSKSNDNRTAANLNL